MSLKISQCLSVIAAFVGAIASIGGMCWGEPLAIGGAGIYCLCVTIAIRNRP